MAGDAFKGVTGTAQIMKFACALGNRCPVQEALRLQQTYFNALKALDAESARWSIRLEQAQFVQQVAKAAADSKEIKAGDVWKNLRPKRGRSDDPTDYKQTLLFEDITRMEKAIEKRVTAAEDAVGALIAHLKKKPFQKHLVRYHSKHDIPAATAAAVYQAQPVQEPVSDNKKALQFRESDHYLALLTEHLAATKKGKEFLAQVMDKDWVGGNPAFADIWGYTAKANSLTEPVGKFLYNVTPVIAAKVQAVISEGKVKTIQDVLKDPDLKEHFSFLKSKLKIDVPSWLEKRATKFGDRAVDARKYLEARNDWKRSLKEFQDVLDDVDAAKKIDSAWVGLTMDTIAFGISIVKITSDFKKAQWKDWMGLVGDFTGLVKTVAEVRSAKILLVSGQGESYAAAKAFTKRLGVLAGIVAVIITIGDIYKGIKGGDWDVVALNSAGLVITGIGIYAAFMEAALLSGICAVLAVVLAIITALVLDPKVIDYLEDTYWGEDYKSRVIPLANSMHEYYKRMFDMKLRFVLDEYDANNSHLMVECGMMAQATPVFVEVLDQKTKKSLGKMRIFPANSTVSGKGKVERDKISWDEHWPFYAKRLHIYKPWHIWDGEKGIKRDAATEYIIKAGIDPSRSSKMAIDKMAQNKTIDEVKFPAVQKPILQRHLDGWKSFYGSQVTYVGAGSSLYIAYPSSGRVTLNVYTKYGGGCKVHVRAIEDRTWPIPNRNISNVTWPIDGAESNVPIPIKAPPDDSYYELLVRVTLVDSEGKNVKTITVSPVRIAYKKYIDKKRR